MGVAAVGIGTAVVLFVKTRERKPGPRTIVDSAADPAAAIQSGPGTQIRFKSGERQLTLEYGSVKQYPDGRTGWTGFHLVMADGTDLKADAAETKGKAAAGEMPKDVTATGHVSLRTSEGVQVQADTLHYDDATGRADIPGPTSFIRGRMSGTGTGAVYERDTGVFTLLADAHVTTAAGPDGTGAVDATARTMTFNRTNNALLFDDGARITHEKDAMAADRATLYLTDDHEQFKVIELRGNARVMPAPGQTSATPAMQAQDIDLAFYEGTQALQRAVLMRGASMVTTDGASRRAISANVVTLTMAPDGKTLTHLEGSENVVVKTPAQNGVPERTITAASLVANGDDQKGLTAAQFTGGVTFVEVIPPANGAAASRRTGTSRLLNLELAGQLDAIEEAQFQQSVKFEAGDVSGDADLGVYQAAKGRLTLRPFAKDARRPPQVTDGSMTVRAAELVDVDLNTNDLHAVGDVNTNTAPGAKKTSAATANAGLFNDHDPTFGQGREFWYTDATKRARYLGTDAKLAKVQQTDNSVTAVDITLASDTNDLSAKGRVESVFNMESPQAGKPASTYRVKADSLDYRDAARTASYAGSPVTMAGPDGTTSSRQLVLTLAAAERKLERLEATTEVSAKLSATREAVADVLIYEAASDRYTLRGLNGRALVLREAGDKPGTCSIMTGATGYFTHSTQAPNFPTAENPGGGDKWDKTGAECTGELKR
jgi:lipopolysaccharide export system protein LptA